MADRFYSVPIDGTAAANVTESATATPGAFVDVRITYDATGNSKFNAIKAVEAVVQALTQDTWPPL